MNYLIEIATTDFRTAEAAAKGGADRIELCSAISEGGLTPSHGLIKRCREKFSTPLFPIIRPRSGDFLYNEEEFDIIKSDVLLCRQFSCDGIVVGFLRADGSIDEKKTGTIVDLAFPMEVTFHRAFDRCKDPFTAVENIIKAGCQRVLTSGQELKATEGIELIKQLVELADDRIVIMPGSGIKPSNIKQIAQATGAVEFHAALRSTVKSQMDFVVSAFDAEGDYLNASIEAEEVKALREALS